MFALFSPTPPAFRDDLHIEGERILLRPLGAGDAAAMYAYASDPTVTRFLPWEPAPSVDSVRPFLSEQVGRRKRGESLGLAIVVRENSRMIGSTDLMDMKTIRGQAELGYLLDRAYWNQGLMTEAAALTVRYGFEALRLNRIVAFADEENVASQRVMQKLGMSYAASETRIVKGERRPYVRYDITQASWEERRPL